MDDATKNKISGYEKVVEFNKLIRDHPGSDIPRTTATTALRIIIEEFDELTEALVSIDKIEAVDALCDLQVVCYGMGDLLGFNRFYAIAEEVPVLDAADILSNLNLLKKDLDKSAVSMVRNDDVIITPFEFDELESIARTGPVIFEMYNTKFPELNLTQNFNIVCDTNLAKFTSNIKLIEKSINIYSTRGVEAEYLDLSSKVGKTMYGIYRKSDGKLLKPYNWKPPEFIF